MLAQSCWSSSGSHKVPAAQQATSRRRHGTSQRRLAAAATPAATAGGGGSQQQAASSQPDHAGLTSLTLEELEGTLKCRQLSTEGSRVQLEQRLASFLAAPGSFPEANCQPAPVVLLGGRLFAGQQQLRRHLQLLLELLQGSEAEPGHPDFDFLLALLQQHPRYAEKVSHPPVNCFRVLEVLEEDQAPIRMFEFRDGRQVFEDFSYRKCIGLNPAYNAHLTFRDAMRQGVRDQLQAYRLASIGTNSQGRPVHRCDACRRMMADGKKLRLEHVQPNFNQLIKDFCAATSLTPPPVDGKVAGRSRGCFTDEAWLAAWRQYHRQNVRQLQMLCMVCVKERARQQREEEAAAAEAAGLPPPPRGSAAKWWHAG